MFDNTGTILFAKLGCIHPSFANRMVPVLSNIIVTREMSEDEFKMQNYKTLNPICNS